MGETKVQNTIFVSSRTLIIISHLTLFPTIILNWQQVGFHNKKTVLTAVIYFSRGKWQLWGQKRKLAALNIENCLEHSRSNLAQNSNVLRWQEDYITQVSDKIEGKLTKKLSQELSRTGSGILGSLSRLDEFLQNPLIQSHCGTTPETSRITLGTNQRTNEDDSQCDPHPEVIISQSQNAQSTDPDDESDTCLIQNAEKRSTFTQVCCLQT